VHASWNRNVERAHRPTWTRLPHLPLSALHGHLSEPAILAKRAIPVLASPWGWKGRARHWTKSCQKMTPRKAGNTAQRLPPLEPAFRIVPPLKTPALRPPGFTGRRATPAGAFSGEIPKNINNRI